jgi:IS1 family transposase
MISRLEAEAAARRSGGQKKAHKHWSWLAMAATTRHLLAFPGGDRRQRRGQALWAQIPTAY